MFGGVKINGPRCFSGMFGGVKINGQFFGFDWLVFFANVARVAHVVALTILFSGKLLGTSVCYTSRMGSKGSLFCSSH